MILLLRGGGKNGNENDVVDAKYDLECSESGERNPGLRVGYPIHSVCIRGCGYLKIPKCPRMYHRMMKTMIPMQPQPPAKCAAGKWRQVASLQAVAELAQGWWASPSKQQADQHSHDGVGIAGAEQHIGPVPADCADQVEDHP